jgi:hypothetical protein
MKNAFTEQNYTPRFEICQASIELVSLFWYTTLQRTGMTGDVTDFEVDRREIFVAVTSDQSRILTCITQVQIDYVEDLFCTEGAGVLVYWPNCPFCWEVPDCG